MYERFFRAIANNSHNSGNLKTRAEAVKWAEDFLHKHAGTSEVQIFEAVACVRRVAQPTEVIEYQNFSNEAKAFMAA
jgi:hypothetical protein